MHSNNDQDIFDYDKGQTDISEKQCQCTSLVALWPAILRFRGRLGGPNSAITACGLRFGEFMPPQKKVDGAGTTPIPIKWGNSDQNSDHGEFEPPEFKSTVNL